VHAALITGPGKLEVCDFADPTPADGGVVVDITYCGVCGTDVHAFTSGRTYTPAICGHEWTGIVSAVGRSVSTIVEGDRVVVGVPAACGSCVACEAGHPAQCMTVASFARGRDADAPPHGGFAPRIAVSADRVIAAHPDLDDETLAQVEPVTVSVHAVNQSRITDGDLAVIQGAGPVGITTMQCALAAGARSAIIVEPNAARRAVAASLGATGVTPDGAAELIAELTGGLGADIVFECSGVTRAVGDAVGFARTGGSVCLVGLADGPASIDPAEWLRKEITVTTALAYVHEEFATAMQHLADGRVRVDALHTSTTQLDGLAAVFDDLASGPTSQMKVLVNPTW